MKAYGTGKSIITVISENIPDELKSRPQWINWRLEKRGGDLTKVPYKPGTERKASSIDLLTWGTFEEAIEVLERYEGVGFVFCSADPYVGVDLDGCVNPETSEVQPWAAQVIENLDSYTELSPSGEGVHIIVRGKIPRSGRRGPVEMYSQDRFFTMTGHITGESG